MIQQRNKSVLIWLYTGCFLIYCMVVIGGITRLTHSGLSMVDWNLFGSLPPTNEADWNLLFEQYKQFPEYKAVNFNFSVEEFKQIFWWEYSHRLLGRLIGVIFIIPFIYFLIRKKISSDLYPRLIVLLLLGVMQGLIGWYMVKSGLKKDPQVSHYRLAIHLISAFILFGFTFLTALNLQLKYKPIPKEYVLSNSRYIYITANLLLILITIQIIFGAFVAGLHAGYVCQTWPLMCEKWIHESVTALHPLWKNFTEGIGGVQFIHRTLAVFAFLLSLLLWAQTRRASDSNPLKRASILLLIVVTSQFILGVITLLNLSKAPLTLGVLHQTGAFFTFAAVLYLIKRSGLAHHAGRR